MQYLTDGATAPTPAPGSRHRILLALLPLVAGLLWFGAAPGHAAGESWSVIGINKVGCNDFGWNVETRRAGLDGGYYTWHARLTSGDKVYMNEGFVEASQNGDVGWTLYSTFSYGAVENPGAYPLTPGQPLRLVLTIERLGGTALTSWTMVAASCDSETLLYNGPTAADLDADHVATPTDVCPSLTAFTANGCPPRARTLTLEARYGPRRVAGRLDAAGHHPLHAHRVVEIWKKRPGPDRHVATRTTTGLGKFKVRVGRGRYYATSPGLVVSTVGQSAADRSETARVR